MCILTFLSSCTNGLHSGGCSGSVRSPDGLVPPEMLRISPSLSLLFPGPAALPVPQPGQGRTCSPCPGPPSLCIQLGAAQSAGWLLVSASEDTCSPGRSCSARGSLLQAWVPPARCNRNVSDCRKKLLPPQDWLNWGPKLYFLGYI